MTSPLDQLADAYGILPSFRDLSGETKPTSPDTKRALLRANGLALDNDAMVAEALAAHQALPPPAELIVESGQPFSMPLEQSTEWDLVLEDESDPVAEGRATDTLTLPPLPSGVHSLTLTRAGRTESITVIAAPASCPSIDSITGQPRLWGVNAALYAMHSTHNGGLGNFEDLAHAVETIGAHGADFLGINPVHSLGWSDVQTISPYSPSHRGFLNTAHIAAASSEGASAHDEDKIQYDTFMPTHRGALEHLYKKFCAEADSAAQKSFVDFCTTRGEALSTFALFETLSETNGPDWQTWPNELQDFSRLPRDQDPERIRFHQWLQWRADAQLATAKSRAKQSGMGLGLYLDLAVGPRRGGAESWCEQSSIAQGVALGAPPDHLSPDGQNWQLAAYAPAKLQNEKYRPLRRIISDTMRHAGMLRIDHVLGMNRSYWIPDDGSPGGYIKQPFEALLAIVAIEAERAGTVVIGEDLGLVPEGFREALSQRGLYSYSVLQYERDKKGVMRDLETLRPNSLLCFGTHDTPTMKGFWTGRDIDWWRKLDWIDDATEKKARATRVKDGETLSVLGNTSKASEMIDADFSNVKNQVHRAMAASPIAMVSVQLDDLCDQTEAQNLPGTIDEHPNWRRRCPVSVDDFDRDLGLADLGKMMRDCGRGQRTPKGN